MGDANNLTSASVDAVKAHWAQVSSFGDDRAALHSDAVKTGQEALALILERVSAAKDASGNRNGVDAASGASASVPAASPAPAASVPAAPATGGAAGNGWESDRILPILKEHLDEDVVKKVKSVFIFTNEKDGVKRRWLLDAKNGKGELREITNVSREGCFLGSCWI